MKLALASLLVFGGLLCICADGHADYVEPTGSVEGRIKIYAQSCDVEGTFYAHDQVSDGEVTLYDGDGDKVDSDDVNSDGEFEFDDVVVGDDYYIKCEADDYVNAKSPEDDKYKTGKFDIDDGETVTKNCYMMSDEELDCTEPIIVTEEVIEPECGSAQGIYGTEDTAFDGTFCAVGTIAQTPTFPDEGDRSEWACVYGEREVECSAKRDKAAPVIKEESVPEPKKEEPEVQAGSEPEPEPKPEQKPAEPEPELYNVVPALGLFTGTTIAFATSAVPLFTTMPMAAKDVFIMPFLGILARRRNEKNWGTVFEQTTKQPIPGTKIVLTDPEGNEVETTYSDQHGRFGFLATDGTYMIQPEKAKYEKNYQSNSDPLYGDVYTGGQITLEENRVLITNIAMNAVGVNWDEYATKKVKNYTSVFSVIKKWSFIVLFYAGFVFTAVITYLYPSVLNFILLGLYTLLFIYDNFIKQKRYGTVQTDSDDPIPFAVVSLHDKETDVKEKFAVTDVIGRYYLLAENGSYNMRVKGQPMSGESFEKQGSVHVRKGLVRENVRV